MPCRSAAVRVADIEPVGGVVALGSYAPFLCAISAAFDADILVLASILVIDNIFVIAPSAPISIQPVYHIFSRFPVLSQLDAVV